MLSEMSKALLFGKPVGGIIISTEESLSRLWCASLHGAYSSLSCPSFSNSSKAASSIASNTTGAFRFRWDFRGSRIPCFFLLRGLLAPALPVGRIAFECSVDDKNSRAALMPPSYDWLIIIPCDIGRNHTSSFGPSKMSRKALLLCSTAEDIVVAEFGSVRATSALPAGSWELGMCQILLDV